MSVEEQERMMSTVASPLIIFVFPAGASVVGRVIGWLILAGALYLAGTALGGRSTFGQMFCMVIWTWLPHAVRGLIQTIYILISGQLIVNQGLSGFVQNSSAVEEMIYTPPSSGQIILTELLSRIDTYLIWYLVLLVIGVMVTTRLPRRKAVLVTLGVWGLLTAVSLLPTIIGGLFVQQAGF
jgi:hypothetical protein